MNPQLRRVCVATDYVAITKQQKTMRKRRRAERGEIEDQTAARPAKRARQTGGRTGAPRSDLFADVFGDLGDEEEDDFDYAAFHSGTTRFDGRGSHRSGFSIPGVSNHSFYGSMF